MNKKTFWKLSLILKNIKIILNFRMEKYKQKLKEIYPNYNNNQIEKVYKLRLKFWLWIIENFNSFYK